MRRVWVRVSPIVFPHLLYCLLVKLSVLISCSWSMCCCFVQISPSLFRDILQYVKILDSAFNRQMLCLSFCKCDIIKYLVLCFRWIQSGSSSTFTTWLEMVLYRCCSSREPNYAVFHEHSRWLYIHVQLCIHVRRRGLLVTRLWSWTML